MKLARLSARVKTLDMGRARPLESQAIGMLRPDRTFYDSRLWRDRVRPAKRKRDPLCQRCKFLGLVVEVEHVDHWVPLADGGHPTDDANLVSLCQSHHSEKTMADRLGQPRFEIAASAPRTLTVA